MKRRGSGISGILIIGVGVSVIVSICLPSVWLIFLLGAMLIWAGLKLVCK